MIFDIILYILLTILLFLVIIISMKITLEFLHINNKSTFFVKFLFFKINITKFIEKRNLSKTSKETQENSQYEEKSDTILEKVEEIAQDLNEDIDFEAEKSEKIEPEKSEDDAQKEKFSIDKIDDYLETLSDVLDILEQLAFCFTIKKLKLNLFIKTEDNAKTGNILGVLWVLYGNVTVFLKKNFIIRQYEINFTPVWDATKTEVLADAHIILNTSILRVVKNIKYKKINEIRKRFYNE